MKLTEIKSCYIGPAISPEEFIPEHFFIYLVKGSITGYDGNKKYTMKAGNYCIVKKNHLARYSKHKDEGEFEKVVIIFDELFLKKFKEKHSFSQSDYNSKRAFILLKKNEQVPNFITSLASYYYGEGKINKTFADIKREELLLILLNSNPGLANALFDFGIPEKIDIEAFMNRNYKFNVTIQRFAYLTGRSLSSFKRDFRKTFQQTPARWLQKKRLEEARFLIEKKGSKPSDIYLDLGFEDLSHFSFAFKKMFGQSPNKFLKAKGSADKKKIST
jgi:AraC family transcriptional regulator, exoenzyme S synthesis regulatory protein ExsA